MPSQTIDYYEPLNEHHLEIYTNSIRAMGEPVDKEYVKTLVYRVLALGADIEVYGTTISIVRDSRGTATTPHGEYDLIPITYWLGLLPRMQRLAWNVYFEARWQRGFSGWLLSKLRIHRLLAPYLDRVNRKMEAALDQSIAANPIPLSNATCLWLDVKAPNPAV